MRSQIERPVLKWNGGKFLDGPLIISYFPKHASFVDVFGGGGNITLRKQRSTFEYYNDIDKRVVNFFEQLEQNRLQLIRRIKWTPYSRLVFERAKRSQQSTGIEGAVNFYISCWMSMKQNSSGGSFRTRGNIGEDDGRYNPAGLWADLSPLFAAAERFRGVHIEWLPYQEIFEKLDHPDTLFYLDPPYLGKTRTSQRLYLFEMISALDHARLARRVRKLKGMVIISGYPSRLYERLYERNGWQIVTKQTRDNKRNVRTEAIWISPNAQKFQIQQELWA